MEPGKRILITGATGFVGRLLALRLARDGHRVVAWVRSPERARSALGLEPELLPTAAGEAGLQRELERCDAVVNLCGEPLFAGRWTAARRRALVDSRVGLTAKLVQAIGRAGSRSRVLVSASAVGWYGDRGDEVLDERSAPGSDFLADLCARWEREATAAEESGVRVAVLRLGIVLGAEGGALSRMLPPFRLGLGGRLGSGRQWMPWIHAADLVELVVRALDDERFAGAFNATAPEPVTNRDFTRELGRALRRPAVAPVPGIALRVAFGGAAEVLLSGQRALPRRALEQGFTFHFPALAGALGDLLGEQRSLTIGPADGIPASPYLERRRPRYVLTQRTRVRAPLETVFAFFSRPENLGALTPSSMGFELRSASPIEMRAGAEIEYALRVGPLPLRWRTRIETWEPGRRFVDCQVAGPYRSWWHQHRFERDGDGTLMEDRVWYAPPLGPLGALAQRLLVAPKLRAIFGYRARAMDLRFGASAAQ